MTKYELTSEQVRFIIGRIMSECSEYAAQDYAHLMADALNGKETSFSDMEKIWETMPETDEEIEEAISKI